MNDCCELFFTLDMGFRYYNNLNKYKNIEYSIAHYFEKKQVLEFNKKKYVLKKIVAEI